MSPRGPKRAPCRSTRMPADTATTSFAASRRRAPAEDLLRRSIDGRRRRCAVRSPGARVCAAAQRCPGDDISPRRPDFRSRLGQPARIADPGFQSGDDVERSRISAGVMPIHGDRVVARVSDVQQFPRPRNVVRPAKPRRLRARRRLHRRGCRPAALAGAARGIDGTEPPPVPRHDARIGNARPAGAGPTVRNRR